MPRFYFDVREQAELQRDDEGLSLADVDEAEREAVAAALTMAKDTFSPRVATRDRSLTIEVREDSKPVLKVALKLDVSRN